MDFRFNDGFLGDPVTESDLLRKFSITKGEFLTLTGVTKLAQELDIDTNAVVIGGSYPTVTLVWMEQHVQLGRKVNFALNEITNESFFLAPEWRGLGIGKRVLKAQVDYAHHRDFKKIKAFAAGSPKDIESLAGFYVWGVLGFTMAQTSLPEFERTMKKHKLPEKSLQELLSKSEGRKHWKETSGFAWSGEFLLHPDSENNRLLNEYLAATH